DRVEVDEPRLEERSRHGFERLVHPAVQFDLVVEGAEDVGDGALVIQRGHSNGKFVKMISIHTWDGGLVRAGEEVDGLQEVANKLRIITFEVTNVQRGIQRPEVACDEEDLPKRAASTGYD